MNYFLFKISCPFPSNILELTTVCKCKQECILITDRAHSKLKPCKYHVRKKGSYILNIMNKLLQTL